MLCALPSTVKIPLNGYFANNIFTNKSEFEPVGLRDNVLTGDTKNEPNYLPDTTSIVYLHS